MTTLSALINEMRTYPGGKCPYFMDRDETIRALRCPGLPNDLHAGLMCRGFRHSGDIFYLPECEGCNKCISMRISPQQFKPSKKQRHIFRKNTDIQIHLTPPTYTDEKYEIYCRYMNFQHPDSPQGTDINNFKRAFYAPMPSSAEIEYRVGNQLAGLTFVDIIPGEALSSIYHFFNPDFADRSIGVFSVLIEIMLCPEFHIPWYYIGYWVPGCKKMEYKSQYKPHELLVNGEWIPSDTFHVQTNLS